MTDAVIVQAVAKNPLDRKLVAGFAEALQRKRDPRAEEIRSGLRFAEINRHEVSELYYYKVAVHLGVYNPEAHPHQPNFGFTDWVTESMSFDLQTPWVLTVFGQDAAKALDYALTVFPGIWHVTIIPWDNPKGLAFRRLEDPNYKAPKKKTLKAKDLTPLLEISSLARVRVLDLSAFNLGKRAVQRVEKSWHLQELSSLVSE